MPREPTNPTPVPATSHPSASPAPIRATASTLSAPPNTVATVPVDDEGEHRPRGHEPHDGLDDVAAVLEGLLLDWQAVGLEVRNDVLPLAEEPFVVLVVVLDELFARRDEKLEGRELEPRALEAADNLADEAPLDAVGLYDNERPLAVHFALRCLTHMIVPTIL